jgi:hypothetical protein
MRSLRPSADKAATHEFMRAAAVTPGKARDRPFMSRDTRDPFTPFAAGVPSLWEEAL